MTIMHVKQESTYFTEHPKQTPTHFQPKVKSICISYVTYRYLHKVTKDKKYFSTKQIIICLVVKYFVFSDIVPLFFFGANISSLHPLIYQKKKNTSTTFA